MENKNFCKLVFRFFRHHQSSNIDYNSVETLFTLIKPCLNSSGIQTILYYPAGWRGRPGLQFHTSKYTCCVPTFCTQRLFGSVQVSAHRSGIWERDPIGNLGEEIRQPSNNLRNNLLGSQRAPFLRSQNEIHSSYGALKLEEETDHILPRGAKWIIWDGYD